MTTSVKYFNAKFGVLSSSVAEEDTCEVGLFEDLEGLEVKNGFCDVNKRCQTFSNFLSVAKFPIMARQSRAKFGPDLKSSSGFTVQKEWALFYFVTCEVVKNKENLIMSSINCRQHHAKQATSKLQPDMLNTASLPLQTLH